jgi:hypothetical protein
VGGAFPVHLPTTFLLERSAIHLQILNPSTLIFQSSCLISLTHSACPGVGQAFPALKEGTRYTIDTAQDFSGAVSSLISNIFQKVNFVAPKVTPTSYFSSPTPLASTSALDFRTLTATITTTPTPITPTMTMTTTLSPTPSATLVQPSWTSTATPTPQYRVP